MGAVILQFNPREQLKEFTAGRGKVSLIRRTGGKKSSPNMLIHGENLATLAGLKTGSTTAKDSMSFEIIAIDPPYNVGGNQGYKNVWKGVSEKGRDWAGDHGAFLDFMEPRLKIGRQLLTDEGVIFVNICDGEYSRLKILMDQVFGEENCLGTIIWDKTQGAPGKHLTDVHEYILVYAKNASKAPRLNKEKPSAQMMIEKASSLKKEKLSHTDAKKIFKKWIKENLAAGTIGKSESYYDQLHPDTFEPFQATPMSAQDNPDGRSKLKLIHPITKKPCKVPPMGWRYSEATLKDMAKYDKCYVGDGFVVAGEIRYGMDETTTPRRAFPLSEGLNHALPTVMKIPHNQGKRDLPDGIEFTTPKPVQLIKDLIRSYPKKDARVLDYFGGSGTTGHAVIELNNEDGGTRSFVLIEEMGSTFNKVLLPRIEAVDKKSNFATYKTEKVPVGGKDRRHK